MTDLLVRDAHLVTDDQSGSATASILIEGGRISQVGAVADRVLQDVAVLDAHGAWVLPGLSDIHCHLCYDFPRRFRNVTDPAIGVVSIGNAAAKLAAGVTLVRDLGAMAQRNVALADAVKDGRVEGPMMVTSGDMISAVGGHMHHYSRQVSSIEDMRRAVNDQIDAGAEWIKLMVSGGLAVSGERWEDLQLSGAHTRAAVEEAHSRGIRVAAHAHPKEAILSAIASGCDTIEHATCIDEEVIDALLTNDVAIVPTLAVYDRIATGANGIDLILQKAAQDVWALKVPALQAAYAAGVRIGIGTDSGGSFPAGDISMEVSLLVKHVGVPVSSALTMASLGNAEILGMAQARGSIDVGKVGDLVLVDADPRADVSALARVSAVVQAGALAGARAGNVSSDPLKKYKGNIECSDRHV